MILGYVADGNPSPFFSRGFMTMQLDFLVADAIVSNSKAGLLAKKAPLKKSFIIYNGFDYSRFKAINVPQMRSELLGDYNHLVCMIARFEKSKDWNSFLNLASLSRKNRQNIHFLAVGGGSELDIYKKKAQEMGLNNISFTGFRKDIEDLVRCCDVSVLFSNSEIHAEGVSNSILESMAAGVPVIANNGGGTNEIIVNGKNGYLVDQADYNAAYEYLSLLIQDSGLRMELSKESQKTVKKDFLLSSMTDNYLKLYNSLLT